MRPPSIPDLNRCSGRIPALPYPPIKQIDCTAGSVCCKEQTIHSGKNSAKSRGLGGGAPIFLKPASLWNCAEKDRPAFDS
jgi:hypothetical protein